MSYRLVVLDLDGTLLGSNNEISPRNLGVLRALHRRGVHVCIATGRMQPTAQAVTATIDFPHTLAVFNGALVINSNTDERLQQWYLSPAETRELFTCYVGLHLEKTCRFDVFTDHMWFATPLTDDVVGRAKKYKVPIANLPPEWPGAEAAKVMMRVPLSQAREIATTVGERFPHLQTTMSTPTLLEVNASNASKGQAIVRLAHTLGIDTNDIVAFGDQLNDVDMLKVAGYAVAMGNAIDDVKQIADHITGPHHEDGVAQVLESLFSLEAAAG